MGKKRGGGQSAAAVEELVRELAEPVVERHGAQLWAVQFVTEGAERYLRILLDRDETPVDLDLCEAISRELDGLLDAADPIEDSYILEVGSAGIDRPLKRQSDFDRFAGEVVDISLYAPAEICGKKQKRFEATLVGLKDGELTLRCEDDSSFILPLKAAASVRLAILFD